MKKYIFIAGVFTFFIFAFLIARNNIFENIYQIKKEDNEEVLSEQFNQKSQDEVGENDKKYSSNNKFEHEFNKKNFIIAWKKIDNPAKLFLIDNFENQLSSSEIIEKYHCNFIVNGGFYSTDNKPIGLFISNGNELSEFRNNKLLNGILSINTFDVPRITKLPPSDKLLNATQSGPIIIENSFSQNIDIENDHDARRVIGAVSGFNSLYFLVIYAKSSVFSGPTLSELPGLLKKIDEELNLNLADAINMDGGTASTFISKSDNFNLSELSKVGSFFCEK